MPIRKSYPVRFTPNGICDGFDATMRFMGACQGLENLIFSHANPEVVVSRPGVTEIYDFADFSTPGVVSVQVTVGNRTYGMISSALNAGKDEPFVYDHDAGAFVAISGVTNANSPTTQATTGPWTPPTIDIVGVNVIITHPGFSSTAHKFGVIDITNPAAPAWSGTDTATNGLTAIPVAVANYRNRAYFAVNNSLEYTDVLSLTRTNSSQVLTMGDSADITAVAGLPIQTTSSGIVAALIAFKEFQVWQVTGDPATSNLLVNFLSLTTGCYAPRSIAQAPRGIYFASVEGPRIIDPMGAIRPVVNRQGEEESDIDVPFINAVEPSRIAGGYNAGVYRCSLETIVNGEQFSGDYWFDEKRRRWNGPHTFNYDCASPLGNYFVLVSNDDPALLIKSQVIPDLTSQYDDLGDDTSGELLSASFPKTGHMAMKQMIESTIELSSAGSPTTYTITAYDDQQNTLSQAQIDVDAAGALWGAFVWGDGTLYASSVNRPRVYNVPWPDNVVFKKLVLGVQAEANAQLAVGAFYGRWADAGYTNVENPA